MLGFEKDTIDFEVFTEKVKKGIQSRIDDDRELIIRPITKLNGIIEHGISFKIAGKNVVPTVYLEDFYDAYNDGMTMTEVVERIYEILDKNPKDCQIDVDFFSDYKQVKGKLGIKLVNAQANEKLLEDVPHKKYLDLAIVCYVAVRDRAIGNGSITIHNNHIMMWGVSEQELIFDAIENVSHIEPGRLFRITDLIKEIAGEDSRGGHQSGSHFDDFPCELFVLTNESRLFGASVLMYKGMLESIAESLESDYYIIPSSIHEVLVLPLREGTNREVLNCMVQEVNKTQLMPVEILSDHVYMYSGEKKQLIACNEA